MTQIVFVINGDSEAVLSDKSKEMLEATSGIIAADWMQDVLFEALNGYNKARLRLGWEEIPCFPCSAIDDAQETAYKQGFDDGRKALTQ